MLPWGGGLSPAIVMGNNHRAVVRAREGQALALRKGKARREPARDRPSRYEKRGK